MRTWRIDPGDPDPAVLAAAAATIRNGGVVAFPTDTLYGLAADPRNAHAVAKIFTAKRRAAREPLPLIVASLEDAESIGRLTPLARRLATAFWPGPLTLVVEDGGAVVPSVHGGTETVAIRVPASAIAAALARAAGGAVTSTSANRSGHPAPSTASEAEAGVGDAVDGLLDGGPAPGGPPSTIVDARDEVPVLLRAGTIAYDRILEVLERR